MAIKKEEMTESKKNSIKLKLFSMFSGYGGEINVVSKILKEFIKKHEK